ncbi:transposase [Kitasatospora aureofaciens]|uniref:transposase n=1 Tax=Kitasatospora aureofaciens TaxID=1894 RepID=UPI00382BB5E9
MLGVDEFAFRRGRRNGTILVDVETRRVVDVLPDRISETFAAWLTEHPGTEIICRDRASAYPKAVNRAAPSALEVADRCHLPQNLPAAVEKTQIVERIRHRHADVHRLPNQGWTISATYGVAARVGAGNVLPSPSMFRKSRASVRHPASSPEPR